MYGLGVTQMAKSKARPRGRPPVEEPKRNVLSLRGTVAWRDWLQELAKHCRLPASAVVDQAIVSYARQQGFKTPPPER